MAAGGAGEYVKSNTLRRTQPRRQNERGPQVLQPFALFMHSEIILWLVWETYPQQSGPTYWVRTYPVSIIMLRSFSPAEPQQHRKQHLHIINTQRHPYQLRYSYTSQNHPHPHHLGVYISGRIHYQSSTIYMSRQDGLRQAWKESSRITRNSISP